MMRRKTKQIFVGGLPMGGGSPVTVQSMTNTPTGNAKATIEQIRRLAEAGCEIVRVTVPDREAVEALPAIRKACPIPLVADIHFDYRLALAAVDAGCDKIRINPGNIGSEDRVRQVVDACRKARVPIRIGVNGGSLEKELLARHGGPTAEALAESAAGHIAILERLDFDQIAVSVKSSRVDTTVEAYRLLAQRCDYPLHVGVTESGTARMGLIRSAAGIGSLLCDGIGDTIRVSLTADPVEEIAAGLDLLRALELRRDGVRFVSCPTCGRTKIDLIALAKQAEEALADCRLPITVAIMGCAVNGPGEAREADIGVAGGIGEGLIFKKGQILRKVPEEQLLSALLDEIKQMEASC